MKLLLKYTKCCWDRKKYEAVKIKIVIDTIILMYLTDFECYKMTWAKRAFNDVWHVHNKSRFFIIDAANAKSSQQSKNYNRSLRC